MDARQAIYEMREQETCEQATGIVENPHGVGMIYSGPKNTNGHVTPGGVRLTVAEARQAIQDGETIEIPNAGAGSYRKVFIDLLDYKKIEVVCWSSSAGDWQFGVFDGEQWIACGQENRYPRHGFRYWVNDEHTANTFEELCQLWQ